MKKIALLIAVIMVFAAMFMFTACKKEVAPAADAPADETVGSYTITMDEKAVELPEDVQKAFDKAMEGYTGAGYTPVAYLGSQVVSGTNYMLLCKSELVTAQPVVKNVVVVIYADLEGNAEVKSVKDLDLDALETAETDSAQGEQLAGGWTVNEDAKGVKCPEDAVTAYKKSLEGLVGVGYSEEPLACLGTKVISGTRYALLTYGTPVTPDGQGFYAVMFTDAMADGTYSIGNIAALNLADYNG